MTHTFEQIEHAATMLGCDVVTKKPHPRLGFTVGQVATITRKVHNKATEFLISYVHRGNNEWTERDQT